jgi:hypothetical protein
MSKGAEILRVDERYGVISGACKLCAKIQHRDEMQDGTLGER